MRGVLSYILRGCKMLSQFAVVRIGIERVSAVQLEVWRWATWRGQIRGIGHDVRCERALWYHLCAGWSSLVARRAHNPEVVGSNPTPATMGAERQNLEAPFFLLVVGRAGTVPSLVHYRTIVPVRNFRNNYEQIAVNRPFHGERAFP